MPALHTHPWFDPDGPEPADVAVAPSESVAA